MVRTYVDCDGVLADFDALAKQVLGTDPRSFEEEHGSDAFWETIRSYPNFYRNLPVLEGALELMEYLEPYRPIILTGSPSYIPEGHFDKQEWVKKVFGSKQPVITCQSKNKSNFCWPGDVIIDDWPKHVSAWEDAGGHWILHKSAAESIEAHRSYIERLEQS